MSATETHQVQKHTLRERARVALWGAAFDHGGIADEIIALVERYVRARFNLTTDAFDLAFTDLKREIEQHLTAELENAVDYHSAFEGIVDEFSEEIDVKEAPND